MKCQMKMLCVIAAICSIAISAIAQGNNANNGASNKVGEKVFQTHCLACHDKGENSVESTKTLKSNALKENGFNGVEDIKKRIINGKGIMPVFGDRLKADEIDFVGNYVWLQSIKDWK